MVPESVPIVTVIVNVPPPDDEQVALVFKNRKRRKEMCRLDDNLFVVAQVPKPSEQRSSATMRTKAKKGSTDLSDLSLNRWLDDMAIQKGVIWFSCQVTAIVVVTDIDVSSTVTNLGRGHLARDGGASADRAQPALHVCVFSACQKRTEMWQLFWALVRALDKRPRGYSNLNGDLTLGTLFRSRFFLDVWQL